MTLTIIDETDFEQIKAEMLAAVEAELPDYSGLLSDPMMVNIHVAAYREWLLRRRINAAARATFPQFALDSDLDERGKLFSVNRLDNEADEALRARILAAPEMFTTAGSVGEYEERTREVSASIKGVHVAPHTPLAGSVTVTVLTDTGDGTPDAAMLVQIDAALNREEIRTLCDTIYVRGPDVAEFQVVAEITPYPNQETAAIDAAARESLQQYLGARHSLGHDVELSGLFASLHVSGVKRVNLAEPVASIVRDYHQVAWCSAVTLTYAPPDI